MTAPLAAGERAALAAALKGCARRGRPMTYAQVAAALALRPPHSIHRLTLALEEMAEADHRAGRPLLAALAVGKAGIPGRGFFQLLQRLGRYDGPDQGPAAAERHRRELALAVAYWGGA